MSFLISSITEYPEFIPDLARWHHEQWQHLNPSDYSIDARIQEYRRCLSSSDIPFMLVAHDTDKPLGSVRLIENDMDNHPELSPWMASLYVHPEFRGQGIGTALIEAIQQQAQQSGFSTLYLFTEDQQELYRKLGWKVLFHEHYHNEKVAVMSLELNTLV